MEKYIFKSIAAASIIFSITLSAVSCTKEPAQSSFSSVETEISETFTISDTITATSATTKITTTSSTTTTTIITTDNTTSPTSTTSETVSETTSPDYNAVELSMLEQAGKPEYDHAEAAIPYVAWTEVNLDKTMYTVSRCYGYEFALPDAVRKMVYDPGIALEVIARTSTGYYRIQNDYYIPCDFLDSTIPEDADPAIATSCAVYIPPVTTAAVTKAVTSTAP